MEVIWKKTLGCSLETEVATTEAHGDVGYVYVYADGGTGRWWTSVYICANGVEDDSFFSAIEKAKESVLDELASDLERSVN